LAPFEPNNFCLNNFFLSCFFNKIIKIKNKNNLPCILSNFYFTICTCILRRESKRHTHIPSTHARTEREELSQLRLAIKIFIPFGSAKYLKKIKYLIVKQNMYLNCLTLSLSLFFLTACVRAIKYLFRKYFFYCI